MITWTLDQKVAEYILNVLSQRPFAEVGQLVPNLARQSQPSMQEVAQSDKGLSPAPTE